MAKDLCHQIGKRCLSTGGAIKLTPMMAEREHTLNELKRMELVRNYLMDNGIVDVDGIKEDTL